MKIQARTSGGFAGRTDCYELDTTCSAKGKSVEDLLRELDFFKAEPLFPVGADIPRWEITVDDGLLRKTVTIAQDGSSGGPGWQALIDHLRDTA